MEKQKITLECKHHDTSYELNHLIHLFEPYVEEECVLESIYEADKAIAILRQGTEILGKREETLLPEIDAVKQKKQMKLMLKVSAYKVLSAYTKQQMPWGILTGIRPTKIVHQYIKEGYTVEAIREKLLTIYQIAQDKVELMIQVAQAEADILAHNQADEINIYIGIPFCPTRCVYCSFTAYSIEAKKDRVEPYLEALCKEISFIAEAQKDKKIRSLYIGGGTPTSLNIVQLERLLSHIKASFDLSKIEEYTVEAGRPDTIDREKLTMMKRMGVGRISINPQTMNQKTLDTIGRRHSVESIKEVFQIAREVGHTNINMDIILGLPGETVEDVVYTLEELKKLTPENITVHTMAIKKASRLCETKEKYQLAEVEKIYEMLACCKRETEEMGMAPYYMYRQKNMLGNFENVGYTKPGYECIYNIEIMEEKQSIIAAGAGAATKMVYEQGQHIERIPNVKSLEDYINRIDEMIARKKEGFNL